MYYHSGDWWCECNDIEDIILSEGKSCQKMYDRLVDFFNIKEDNMKFDKRKVYTAVTADEAGKWIGKQGWFADSLKGLEITVCGEGNMRTLRGITGEFDRMRFRTNSNMWSLFYPYEPQFNESKIITWESRHLAVVGKYYHFADDLDDIRVGFEDNVSELLVGVDGDSISYPFVVEARNMLASFAAIYPVEES